MITGCSPTPPTPTTPPSKNPKRLNPKRSKGCEKKCCRCIPGALNLSELRTEQAAPKANWGKVKVMPIASIKPKIVGLVLHGGRIQFFLQGTYSARLVERQGRLSIQAACQSILCTTQGHAVITIKNKPTTTTVTINKIRSVMSVSK